MAGHLLALIVGTGTDSKGKASSRFQSCINDAEWLAQVLQEPMLCGYQKENIKLLVGEHATRKNILNELDAIKDRVLQFENEDEQPTSTVIVFFSGHGLKAGEKTYLMPHGYREPYEKHAIAGELLYEKFKLMESAKILLLLNTCYSGSVMPKLSSDDQELPVHDSNQDTLGAVLKSIPLDQKQMERLLKGKGFAYLCAAQSSQQSETGYLNALSHKRYSPFTLGLARGFTGANKVGSGVDSPVYFSDLASVCVAYVSSKTNKRQLPHFDFRGDNFAVGYYRAGSVSRYPLLSGDVTFDIEADAVEIKEKKKIKPRISQKASSNRNTVTGVKGNYFSGVNIGGNFKGMSKVNSNNQGNVDSDNDSDNDSDSDSDSD